MRIVLSKDTVFADRLSYEQACQSVNLANRTTAGRFMEFFIRCEGNTEKSWQLMGRSIEMTREFMSNPDEFVIEV